jgi:hypothetical protein
MLIEKIKLVEEIKMSSFFDDNVTLAMGGAFDRACRSLGRFAHHNDAREIIAKKIIEAAINGERDPERLHSAGPHAIRMDDTRMPVTGGPGKMPVGSFAAMARVH